MSLVHELMSQLGQAAHGSIPGKDMGLSENVGLIFPMKWPFNRDNDHENHWVQWGTLFSDKPI